METHPEKPSLSRWRRFITTVAAHTVARVITDILRQLTEGYWQ